MSGFSVPNGVTNIQDSTFNDCFSITNITLGPGVMSIGDYAFYNCDSLAGLYFAGNAPEFVGSNLFDVNQSGTVYYPPDRSGWTIMFQGRPTALWLPQVAAGSFSTQANQFGFSINWADGQTVIVEACTNLNQPVWQPLQTNMITSGSISFSDPASQKYPSRFYRLRSP